MEERGIFFFGQKQAERETHRDFGGGGGQTTDDFFTVLPSQIIYNYRQLK